MTKTPNMRFYFRLIVAVVFILLITLLKSCNKKYIVEDIKLSTWEPVLAAPIAFIDIHIRDIIKYRELAQEELEFILSQNPEFDYDNYLDFSNINLPVVVDLTNYEFWFDAPFSFELTPGVSNAKNILIRTREANNLPFDSYVQGFLFDANGNFIDSLYTGNNNIIKGTDRKLVFDGGKTYYEATNKKTTTYIDETFTESRLENALKADKLIFRTKGIRQLVTDSVLLDTISVASFKFSFKIVEFQSGVELNN